MGSQQANVSVNYIEWAQWIQFSLAKWKVEAHYYHNSGSLYPYTYSFIYSFNRKRSLTTYSVLCGTMPGTGCSGARLLHDLALLTIVVTPCDGGRLWALEDVQQHPRMPETPQVVMVRNVSGHCRMNIPRGILPPVKNHSHQYQIKTMLISIIQQPQCVKHLLSVRFCVRHIILFNTMILWYEYLFMDF